MIDRIVMLTMKLKQALLCLGYELPPVMWMHNNKIKQIHMDLTQMLHVVLSSRTRASLTESRKHSPSARGNSQTLFDTANSLFASLTAKHSRIHNFTDLLQQTQDTCDYVASY